MVKVLRGKTYEKQMKSLGSAKEEDTEEQLMAAYSFLTRENQDGRH